MSIIESYLFLFCDSIMASLVLLPNTPMVFNAMQSFGGFNEILMLVLSVLGNTIGSSLNFVLGRILHYVKKNVEKSEGSQKFIELKEFSNKRLFFLSFFSFVPLFGVVLTLAAGFLKISYYRFVMPVIIGRVVYYFFIA